MHVIYCCLCGTWILQTKALDRKISLVAVWSHPSLFKMSVMSLGTDGHLRQVGFVKVSLMLLGPCAILLENQQNPVNWAIELLYTFQFNKLCIIKKGVLGFHPTYSRADFLTFILFIYLLLCFGEIRKI